MKKCHTFLVTLHVESTAERAREYVRSAVWSYSAAFRSQDPFYRITLRDVVVEPAARPKPVPPPK